MQDPDVQSPHRLVEFLAAISRCEGVTVAVRVAAELVAEEFDAEVGAVVVGQTLSAAVGFGQNQVPSGLLTSIRPGTGTITLDDVGPCLTLAAAWNASTSGRLVVARVAPGFESDDRNLLLGMAGALGMALDMIGALERERERHRVLEVLLEIQSAISHRAPLSTILAAITDGASTVLHGCPVSLVLDDVSDPTRPIIAGADLTCAVATVSAPVHIDGVNAGALVASTRDGALLDTTEESLLRTFAEHASLALTDARTVEVMQAAFRDPLTGLPNRPLFVDRLSQALRQRDPLRSSLSVLFIDLDRFKAVNDSLGHAAGDTLLRAVAQRILGCTRSGCTVARFGGDEFALLLQDDDGEVSCAQTVAARIIAALREAFTINDKIVFIGAAIGIAHVGGDQVDVSADEMLSNADLAMYRAKRRGSGQVGTYDPSMRVALLERLDLQEQLQGALARNELTLRYQPIVDLDTGSTVGLEALLRWEHPRRGRIPPSEFVPIAEATGLIVDIGRFVLNKACQQLAHWRRFEPGWTMNINVSAHQLREPSFIGDIDTALCNAELPGAAIILEITEGVLIEDQDLIFERLRELEQVGVKIALDDFGTGYSSLGYLQKFPVDILKIDRSFVSGPASGSGGDQLVRTIIELGRAFALDVVAEGIETEAQRSRLRELGCRRGQGYYFAKPLPPSEIDSQLAAHRVSWGQALGPQLL